MKPKQENKNVSEPQLKPYPEWVCASCGDKSWPPRVFEASTWHLGACDVCGSVRGVTQPRDFGHPTFEGHEKP